MDIDDINSRIDTFTRGSEAIKEFKESYSVQGQERRSSIYKVILTDLSMPEIDGYRLVSQLRKFLKKNNIPKSEWPLVVAITGHTESEFFLKAFDSGCDHIYSKPISSSQIELILLEAGFKLTPSSDIRDQISSWHRKESLHNVQK